MRGQRPSTIPIRYHRVEDHHVFTSDELYGLYVASTDLKTAFDNIAPSVEALMELNHRKKVSVELAISFHEFVEDNGLSEPWERAPQNPPQVILRTAA